MRRQYFNNLQKCHFANMLALVCWEAVHASAHVDHMPQPFQMYNSKLSSPNILQSVRT
jgi:hypothetical protein